MKERPIPFQGAMVRALLAGTKTQTRRAVKGIALEWLQPDNFTPEFVALPENHLCPYGFAGDRLWVRESYSGPHWMTGVPPRDWLAGTPIWYWADGNPRHGDWTKPKPPMHLPRIFCRTLLEIIAVRAERVQAISRGDAMDEGCPFPNMAQGDDPRQWYADLWDSINGPGSWDANPWVWVVEFRRVQP